MSSDWETEAQLRQEQRLIRGSEFDYVNANFMERLDSLDKAMREIRLELENYAKATEKLLDEVGSTHKLVRNSR